MSETMERRSNAWPGAIATITLFVEDLEGCKAFYQRAFGLQVTFEDPDSAVFRFGDTLVNLLKVSAAPELIEPARVAARDAGSRSVFTIEVDDVDTVCADLRTRGVALLNGPIDRPWGPRTASFTDLSGNIWEIAH
jgi:catechol 2,3-dioxygenase-like lactoylglutathione lyase family enzyme